MNSQDIVGVTPLIAGFAVATDYDEAAPGALKIAGRCVVDGAAVMPAGSTEPGARVEREYLARAEGVSAVPARRRATH